MTKQIHPGDTLLVLGDEAQGLTIVKPDVLKELALKILGANENGPIAFVFLQ